MADLHWFPFFAKDFLASPAVRRMSDAQVGRYVILLATAWDDGAQEPSLEAADMRKVPMLVKRQFEEREGRYYNSRLSEVWREQQGRHAKATEKARNAGRASGRRRANPKSTPSSLEVNHASMTMSIESRKDSLVRGAGALAPSGAPPAEPSEKERRNGGGMAKLDAILPAVMPR